jgi:hypothetical protein
MRIVYDSMEVVVMELDFIAPAQPNIYSSILRNSCFKLEDTPNRRGKMMEYLKRKIV